MDKRKLSKEDINKVRGIVGFPMADDEDIISLSEAPFYTSCPNPFIEEFIDAFGTLYDEDNDSYQREPFTSDVSEGKNDPIYMAHSYHTKVPYKAIMRYILHYTKPGEIVFDGFAGTGMTGVAGKMCEEDEYGQLSFGFEKKNKVEWGARSVIMSDLSPAATFIAHHYNDNMNASEFRQRCESILAECKKELGWMFETTHAGTKDKGTINYIVWSDVFICPHCGNEIVFWDAAVDHIKGKVNDKFNCPHCSAQLAKRDCEKSIQSYFDVGKNKICEIAKQVPVLINYTYGGKRYEKKPEPFDLELIDKIDRFESPYWYPTDDLPDGYNTEQPKKSNGIYTVDQFYYRRNLIALAAFVNKARKTDALIILHSVGMVNTKLYRYRWAGGFAGAGGGPLAGTLYVPSIVKDINIYKSITDYINKITKVKSLLAQKDNHTIISTQSSSDLSNIRSNSVDYIFTDPPFGANLNYSELSFIWESWLKVKTNAKTEAIMNPVQGKGLPEYQELMTLCFMEFFRILKPNRWMTVEFHNSKNSVWNAIQEALLRSGFVIADVRTLDKKQGSFKQVTTSSAVKQDLVISAYKPRDKFRKTFLELAGTEESAWTFIQQHLSNLPVVVDSDNDGRIDIVSERQAFLLFDRMVGYHIMNGIPVPLDATDFYKGLESRYLMRDSMYFLPDQVNEYDLARIKMDVEPVQFEMFVTNEKSAIAWLYQQLDIPQTYAEIQPKFMQELKAVDKYEDMPELQILLEENFLQNEEGKWYIPDITKEADVAKLREKKLLKEFEGYLATKGKLRLFRTEAIRVGFAKLWADKNYKLIVETAERLPEQIIQEDDKLLMYYDISLGRV